MSLLKLPEIKAHRLPEVCAFEPDADALEKWNAALAPKAMGENTITILDAIGSDFFGDGVTAKRIAAALRSIGDNDVVVEINSPGGDFFEGVAIYNMLRAHPHKVTVRILGMAASAASVIAMAGDEIEIGKVSEVMIHNAWFIAMGNRHEFVEYASALANVDDSMAVVYSERSGMDKAKVAEYMDNETWFKGQDAIDAGLATAFLPADAMTEDQARASVPQDINATRRIDALLAKTGMSRSERRALLADAKGGTHDAAPAVTHDADEIKALIEGIFKT